MKILKNAINECTNVISRGVAKLESPRNIGSQKDRSYLVGLYLLSNKLDVAFSPLLWRDFDFFETTDRESVSLFFNVWYSSFIIEWNIPAGNYIFKLNQKNTWTKLTIKTLERLHWRRSGVVIASFEHISHLVLVFLLLTLSR